MSARLGILYPICSVHARPAQLIVNTKKTDACSFFVLNELQRMYPLQTCETKLDHEVRFVMDMAYQIPEKNQTPHLVAWVLQCALSVHRGICFGTTSFQIRRIGRDQPHTSYVSSRQCSNRIGPNNKFGVDIFGDREVSEARAKVRLGGPGERAGSGVIYGRRPPPTCSIFIASIAGFHCHRGGRSGVPVCGLRSNEARWKASGGEYAS